MSSSFSTVINFGMLSLLRRLHRLHIQFCLEAESEQTRIKYTRVEGHKNKDGHHHPKTCDVSPIDNEQIAEAVERARDSAKRMTDTLGMAELLKKHNCWENPPTPVLDKKQELHNEDDFDDNILADDDVVTNLLQEDISADDPEDVASGVLQLTSAGIIGNDLSNRLQHYTNHPSRDFQGLHCQCLKSVMCQRRHPLILSIARMLKLSTMAKHYVLTRQQLCGYFKRVKESLLTVFSE